MKIRIASIVLVVCLIFGVSALAEGAGLGGLAERGNRWANGNVRAKETIDLFAPIGGQLNPFDWSVGDTVEAGDTLISVRPIEVRAAFDGIVRSLNAQVGDVAADVIAQYGALCYIERNNVHRINATTATGFNDPENRAVRMGETLRVHNAKAGDPKESAGSVIWVSGDAYTIEIPADIFKVEDEVRVYRGRVGYSNADRMGKGFVERPQPVAVLSDGVIAAVNATEGKRVSRGDVLFCIDSISARHDTPANPEIAAVAGMIEKLLVQPGQQVQKGQLLLSIQPLTQLELEIDVDELDIPALKLDQAVEVRVDALPKQVYEATIEKVSPLPITVLDATKYRVTLMLDTIDPELLPGMHVTAYWD